MTSLCRARPRDEALCAEPSLKSRVKRNLSYFIYVGSLVTLMRKIVNISGSQNLEGRGPQWEKRALVERGISKHRIPSDYEGCPGLKMLKPKSCDSLGKLTASSASSPASGASAREVKPGG